METKETRVSRAETGAELLPHIKIQPVVGYLKVAADGLAVVAAIKIGKKGDCKGSTSDNLCTPRSLMPAQQITALHPANTVKHDANTDGERLIDSELAIKI